MNSATIGKILGALGLVLVLSTPVTLLTAATMAPAAVKLGLGVALIAAFFFTNASNLGQFLGGRSSFFVSSSVLTIALVVALLGALNVVAAKRNKSWDITTKKVNSLAPQTTSALKGLKEKVTAVGFADPKDAFYDLMEQLLSRYKTEGGEKFEYSFKSPKKAPDLVQKYQLRQGQQAIVLTKGEGNAESHTTVNVPSEQELTNGLLKLAGVGEKRVYFVVGHGEWSLDAAEAPEGINAAPTDGSAAELKRDLTQEGYAPETLNLVGKPEVPSDAALLIVAGPKQPISAPEVATLKKYLEQGGRLAVFAEPNTVTGLDALLAEYGLQYDNGVLADRQFAVDSPYNLISLFYGEHEITKLLQSGPINTQFVTARGITLLREGVAAGVKAQPLVFSSPQAWEESTLDQNPALTAGEKAGKIAMAALSTKPVAADVAGKRFDETRVIAFGDSELLVDAFWGHEGNRNLVLNALAWGSDQMQKVTIRPPDRDISTIDLDRDMLARVRLVSTDLLPLSVLGLGLAIWLTRRNK